MKKNVFGIPILDSKRVGTQRSVATLAFIAAQMEHRQHIIDSKRMMYQWDQHKWMKKHGKDDSTVSDFKRTQMLRSWFEFLDADGSGEVGIDELGEPLVSVGLAKSREDVKKLIAAYDADGSGEINFEDFTALMNENHESSQPVGGKKEKKDEMVENVAGNPVLTLFNGT